ncbi:MAG TPA: hypothetical protein VLH75_20550 [Longimicrobiales bacterium]|nr:hypothetical protein [Longimicrobiales bacterium]
MPEIYVAALTPKEVAGYAVTAEKVGRAALELLLTTRAVRSSSAQVIEICQLMEDRVRDLYRELLRGRDETVPNEHTFDERWSDALTWLPVLLLAFEHDRQERPPWSEGQLPAWDYITRGATCVSMGVLEWARAHGCEWATEEHVASAEAMGAHEHGVEWADPDGCTVEAPADA